ncbi:hypothetical protein [Flammeovirga agarivorans]|uniref:Inosine/uridine-preferring nucleoside hydrolase domain-containing protein n=1 Tax=Flammeovirga agarivorans TaxID=2726742 RepID=A0A7X8SNC9_9BACT|nr:hypothetical protein [Flammeovirga agarivorans]NLR93386.1 hypothetical protein [Flammeovirga agarivorans]
MKNIYTYIVIIFYSLCVVSCSSNQKKVVIEKKEIPNVIITTDINNKDYSITDEHAFLYLLWYLNNVSVQSVMLDEYNDYGLEILNNIIQCYAQDYKNQSYSFEARNFPSPDDLKKTILTDKEKGIKKVIRQIRQSNDSPTYFLVLGSMKTVKEVLFRAPDLAKKVRVISVASGIKPPDEDVCGNLNWNGWGRTEIFERFTELWWIENDWAFKGISEGEESNKLYKEVIHFGAMGKYLSEKENTFFNLEEAIPFMFLIDPQVNTKYPEFGGWTGNYIKPFPVERPNYWVDRANTKKWNYQKPCNTWDLAFQVLNERKMSIVDRRDDMSTSLLSNLNKLYSSNK